MTKTLRLEPMLWQEQRDCLATLTLKRNKALGWTAYRTENPELQYRVISVTECLEGLQSLCDAIEDALEEDGSVLLVKEPKDD